MLLVGGAAFGAFGLTDSLHTFFLVPLTKAHPFVAGLFQGVVFALFFVSALFVALRVPSSRAISLGVLVVVGAMLLVLHQLK
ncbi:MAG: hypothetical protein WDO13_09570 [Verrucomicrobiota bacterium]